ncbi:MAG: SIMPL domain-containing protein, partial [Chloroflexota bacterium]
MKMRKNMAMVGVATLLLVTMLAAVGCEGVTTAAPQINIPGTQQTGIWVTGRGEAKATPDVAVINLGVQAQAQSVEEAQDMASAAMQDVMAALEANGIADEDIKTTGYNIWQQTRWNRDNEEEEVTGYEVSNDLEVRVRNIENAGEVVDAVTRAGGDLIRAHDIQLEVDDPSEYLAAAREDAVKEAKEKAEQMAELAGVNLGTPTFISEGSQTPVVYPERAAMEEAEADDAGPPPISPGETTITATVQIVY